MFDYATTSIAKILGEPSPNPKKPDGDRTWMLMTTNVVVVNGNTMVFVWTWQTVPPLAGGAIIGTNKLPYDPNKYNP